MPTIRFLKQFEEAVRSGQKTSTVRRGKTRLRKGKVELKFGDSSIEACITDVRESTFGQLNDEDARRDGFGDVKQLHSALLQIYPGIEWGDTVSVITFDRTEDG